MSKRSAAAKRAAAPPPRPLLASGADVGEVMTRQAGRYQRARDEAFNAELSTVNQALNEAATGKTARLINLLKGTRTRDSRHGAVCRTRVLAVQRPWVLNPPPGEEKTREGILIADRCRRILGEVPGFGKTVGHLGHGILESFGVAEHQWRKNDRGEVVSVPRWRHPNRFAWNVQTESLCWSEVNASDPRAATFPGVELNEYPGKFIVHAPVAGDSDYPWMRGVQRSRAIASVLKRLATRWGIKSLERWGQPQVFVTGRDGDSMAINDELMDMLRAIGSSWIGRFPEGVEPKTIPAATSELHLRWIETQNTEDAIALLGQNLTTEVTAGSFAAAQAHRHVRLDILASDLSELAETLTDQWVRLLVEYNWPGAPVPVLDFVLAPKGEITVAHYQAGLFTADEVRNSMGADPEPDGKGSRYFVAPPTQALFAAPHGTTAIAAPPGGAVAVDPFPQTPSASKATATDTSPTKSPLTHPLARALSHRSAAPAR